MWGWISYKTVPGWCYSAIKKKKTVSQLERITENNLASKSDYVTGKCGKRVKKCCYSFLVNSMLTYILVHHSLLEIELIDAVSSV